MLGTKSGFAQRDGTCLQEEQGVFHHVMFGTENEISPCDA
jgi:hypothetical protein